MFLLKGGYSTLRRCLRKRGWVELEYSKGTTAPAAKVRPKKARKRHSSQNSVSSSDSSDDSDVADLGDQSSEEEYSDEEEYCMLVRGSYGIYMYCLAIDLILAVPHVLTELWLGL